MTGAAQDQRQHSRSPRRSTTRARPVSVDRERHPGRPVPDPGTTGSDVRGHVTSCTRTAPPSRSPVPAMLGGATGDARPHPTASGRSDESAVPVRRQRRRLARPALSHAPHRQSDASRRAARRVGRRRRRRYTARAFLDGTLVSNVAATERRRHASVSSFPRRSPETVGRAGAGGQHRSLVHLQPPALSAPNQNLGTVTLPTYQVPQTVPVTFMVRGSGNGAPIVGAAAAGDHDPGPDASTTTPPGITRFWQSTTTGANGNANLSLIPGVNQTPRLYDVTRRAATRIALRVHLRPAVNRSSAVETPRRSSFRSVRCCRARCTSATGRAGRRRHRDREPRSGAGQGLLRHGSDRRSRPRRTSSGPSPCRWIRAPTSWTSIPRPGRRRLVSASPTSS